jgi:hypothetical protein
MNRLLLLVAVVICPGNLLAAGRAYAQAPAPVVHGVSQSELQAVLGSPHELPDATGLGGTKLFRYRTAAGPLLIYVKEGRTSVHRPLRRLDPVAPGNTRSGKFISLAKARAKNGDNWGVLALLHQCVQTQKKPKDCLSQLERWTKTYTDGLEARILTASEYELADAGELLQGVLALQPSSVAAQEGQRRANATFMMRFIAPRATAARATFVESVNDALRRGEIALSQADYAQAAREANLAIADSRAQALLARIRAGALESIAAPLIAIDDAPKALRRVESVAEVLGPDVVRQARSDILESTARLVRARIGVTSTSSTSARAIAGLVRRTLPGVSSDPDFPWRTVSGAAPLLALSATIAVDDTCGNTLSKEAVRDTLQRALPETTISDSPERLSLTTTVSCAATISREPASPVPSVYRAGSQQIANPDYVTLQSQLQAAQTHLAQVRLKWALNPPQNGWSGFAKGLEESTAERSVSTISTRLKETAPYLERGVDAPYTLFSTGVKKVAIVNYDLQLRLVPNGKLFVGDVRLGQEASGQDISGAMSSDQKGYRNADANLPPDNRMFEQTIHDANADDFEDLRSLIRESLLTTVDIGGASTAPLDFVGLLMYARDFSKSNESLPAEYSSILQSFENSSLESVRGFKAALPKKPTSTAATVARRKTPTAMPRAEMVATALAAVATIETDQGSGSGFFVSSTGDLLTNAHVVQNARRIRIRTHTRDVFLATIVRLNASVDVALLRVSGYEGPFLTMATDDSVAVGGHC